MNITAFSNLQFLSDAAAANAELGKVAPPGGFFLTFSTMLSSILNIVLTIGVIAVLLYLIWGGIEWITSGGDKGKTESARNKITSAVIGLVILVSAWAILQFVQTLLDIKVF
jgi:TRAP-type C4-dicarboxylate transport system permease small subunit